MTFISPDCSWLKLERLLLPPLDILNLLPSLARLFCLFLNNLKANKPPSPPTLPNQALLVFANIWTLFWHNLQKVTRKGGETGPPGLMFPLLPWSIEDELKRVLFAYFHNWQTYFWLQCSKMVRCDSSLVPSNMAEVNISFCTCTVVGYKASK